jgi:hypothetical protein
VLTKRGGHEQLNELISNGGKFKPAFAKSDKKRTMIDLRGISLFDKLVYKPATWFKNHNVPSQDFQDCGLWETAWVV